MPLRFFCSSKITLLPSVVFRKPAGDEPSSILDCGQHKTPRLRICRRSYCPVGTSCTPHLHLMWRRPTVWPMLVVPLPIVYRLDGRSNVRKPVLLTKPP